MSSWRQSEIGDLLTCGELYRRSHLTDEEPGTTAIALQGTAVHFSMANHEIDFRDWNIWANAADVGLMAEQRFIGLSEEDKESEDPIPWRGDALLERAEETFRMGVALWDEAKQIFAEWGSPSMVEHTFSDVPLRAPGPAIFLEGTWDVLTNEHNLIDWKSSIRGWMPGKEKQQVQPLVYARGAEHVTGEWPRGFLYVIVTRQGKVTQKRVDISKERYIYLQNLLPELDRQREKEIFPMNHTSGLCSPVWCPWFNRGCPAKLLKG